MELDDLRRSSVNSLEEIRQETSSPSRAVPKGSDVFQKAMVQLYIDMKQEKEKKRQRRQNGHLTEEEEEEEEDFSDEERDKCTDIKQFRRFSQDFSAKQHHFRRTASLHHVITNNSKNSVNPSGPKASSPISINRLPNVSELRMSDKKIFRRHSIAILPSMD